MAIVLQDKHLSRLKNTATPGAIIKLLESYTPYRLNNPLVIKKYHDLLLFYRAFPFNKMIVELTEKELSRIAGRIKTIYTGKNFRLQNSLMGSGIPYSGLLCSYSLALSHWMVHKFPGLVTFYESGATKETARNILQALTPSIEFEKSSQGALSLLPRIKQLSGLSENNQLLKWLLQLFTAANLTGMIKEELYRQLNIFIYWKLDDQFYNRSFLRWPVKRTYYHKKIIKDVSAIDILSEKINKPVLLSAAEKVLLIDTMRAALAFQYRETEPVTYADSDELEFFEMGRGLTIAVSGMTKDRRLSLESYIGYMVFKNGLPVSYGGGWIWGSHCKIGINIYDPFRKGESAWLFCQVLRIYHHHYKVNQFLVNPYQFGKDNPEGLKSGAFWFYYKLGFRPANDVLKEMAEKEWGKVKTSKKYRTPLEKLKQFTGSNMEWQLQKGKKKFCSANHISAAVTGMINKEFQGERKKAIELCLKRLVTVFPALKNEYNNRPGKEIIENWSFLFRLVPGNWSREHKNAFQKLIQLKHRGTERQYILFLQQQNWLMNLLSETIN